LRQDTRHALIRVESNEDGKTAFTTSCDLVTMRAMDTVIEDGSNGYEAVANIYIAGRGTRSRVGDSIGAAVVKAWAGAFRSGATVLDLGSGPSDR
jgi:hypothetical protein